jgi:hypothetical protein
MRMSAFIGQAKILAFISVVLVVSGCATPTQKLSDADRGIYSAVRISQSVEMPKEPYLLAPGGSVGLMFGAVGGLAAGGSIENERQVFRRFLEKNSISIKQIALQEIELALRESKKLKIVPKADASAPEIRIAVLMYGFSVPHLLSSNVVPVVNIKCEMVDASGKTIWVAGDRTSASIANPITPISWESLQTNPPLIADQWRQASKIIASKIMTEL